MEDLRNTETEERFSIRELQQTPSVGSGVRSVPTVLGEHVGRGTLQHAHFKPVVSWLFAPARSATPPPLREIAGRH